MTQLLALFAQTARPGGDFAFEDIPAFLIGLVTLLAIIGISALISIFRGLVREVLSLLAWGCAFWVAWRFMQEAAGWFGGVVSVLLV